MNNGWIKLHRKIIDSVVFKNEKCLKIWIWILSKANHKQNETIIGRQKITIKTGQFIMGGIKAEQVLDIARKTIYYWLDFMEREGMIAIKKTNKYTIITIPNWDKYQEVANKCPSNDTTNAHQMPTNNNDNNVNNEKNITSVRAKAQPREDINILLEGIKKIVGVIDGSKQEQRNFAKNFLDSKTPEILRQSGNLNPNSQQIINATLRIFQLATQDSFHRKNCNSLKYVYNKAASIVLSQQNNKPKISIIS